MRDRYVASDGAKKVGVLHKAINMLLLLRDSLRCLCVLCVSAVKIRAHFSTAETQRTQRQRREDLFDVSISHLLVQKRGSSGVRTGTVGKDDCRDGSRVLKGSH